MDSLLFGLRGKGKMLARFFMLYALVAVTPTLAAETAHAGPANDRHNPNQWHGPNNSHEVLTLRQALAKKDKSNVTVRANITKGLGGNRYTISDKTGSTEAQIGKKELEGLRVPTSGTVLLRGEVKKDKNRTVIHVRDVI